MDSCAKQSQAAPASGSRLWKQPAPAGAGQGRGFMAWYKQYLGKVCGFIPPPVFPRLSRLCCCWCVPVPRMVCPVVLWC